MSHTTYSHTHIYHTLLHVTHWIISTDHCCTCWWQYHTYTLYHIPPASVTINTQTTIHGTHTTYSHTHIHHTLWYVTHWIISTDHWLYMLVTVPYIYTAPHTTSISNNQLPNNNTCHTHHIFTYTHISHTVTCHTLDNINWSLFYMHGDSTIHIHCTTYHQHQLQSTPK